MLSSLGVPNMVEVGSKVRRPRARVSDWDRHKDLILRLYETEDKPLRMVREIMQRDHDFEASERMYKTRFKAWGVQKYRVGKSIERQIRYIGGQCQETPTLNVEDTSQMSIAELRNDLQDHELAVQVSPGVAGEAHLLWFPSSPSHEGPSPSDSSSYQHTVMSTANLTPNLSRETSRPSSSERASLSTPDSSGSGESCQMSPWTSPAVHPPSVRNQNLLGNESDVRVLASTPSPKCPIPPPVHIVEHVMRFSSAASSGIPRGNPNFGNVMRDPLDGSMYRSDTFRQKLSDKQSTDTDLEGLPKTWTKLCFYINVMLGSGKTSEAKHAIRRAALIYQRLVRERNDQLLSILNLVLTWLFLHGKPALAVGLLSHAQVAASKYLDKEDPIMVSIAFMIAMARKETRTCEIKIKKLRQVVEQMRASWGESHPYCITASYHLAWRLAMESDLRQEGLDILRQTQLLSERVLDRQNLQTVALITTQARVLGHLGRHDEALEFMSQALQRIQRWNSTEDNPYYVEAKRRYRTFWRNVFAR